MVLGIILIVASVFLVVVVLMQHGKSHNLSGTIAGASETFFGKTKATTVDRKLSTVTTIVAAVFVVLVLAVYLLQDNFTSSSDIVPESGEATVTESAGESEPPVSESADQATESVDQAVESGTETD